jgi:hypothetical protein
MRIYSHREDRHEAEAVETGADVVIGEVLEIDGDETVVVLVEDSDAVVDITLTFEQAGISDRAHVFHGKRHRIEAVVSYNGETHEREFGAAKPVSKVFEWATGKHAFGLGKADAAEHQLALAADNSVPAPDVHLGSLAQHPPGTVRFNLIPKGRHEG